jgi:hypothetical protein
VDVFVAAVEGKAAVAQLRLDRIEACEQRVAVLLGEAFRRWKSECWGSWKRDTRPV